MKETIKLGAPLLAGLFAEYVMFIADSAMVGRLSTDHLAAIAVGGLIAEILWVFSWTTAPGTQALTARRFGREQIAQTAVMKKQRQGETGDILAHAIVFSLFSGLTALLVSLFAKPVLNGLLDDGRVIGLAYDYIKIVRWAMPIIAVFYGIYGFIAGIGRTKTVMIASVMTNLLNLLFNYVLIHGKLGLPAMGMKGAAWGTLAAQSIGCLYFLSTVLFDPVYKKYRRFSLKTFNWVLVRDIGRSCIPITLQNLSNQVFFLIYESFVAGYGTIYLGIMHVLFILYWTGKMISGGFAEGASILVGNALGRKEKEEALRYSWAGVTIAVIIGAVIASVTFFFPETVIRIFNNDPALLEAGRSALRFLAVFFFIELFGFPFEIIFTHNGWGGFVLISDFTTNGVFLFVVSYLLINVIGVGIYGAYLPFALYLVFHATVLTSGFFTKKWMVRRIDSLS